MEKPKILIIGTGGTITAKRVNGSWVPGKISEKELLKIIPEISKIAEINSLNLFRTDSSNLQPYQWVKIAKCLKENWQKYDGFVITHGTDTMAYTASALSFLIHAPNKPIILTGSQVPPHNLGTDAIRNMIDAVRVAATTDVHEVAIVFNTKIMRGNRAKKMREMEYEAFESINMLPLGVVEHDIRFTGEHYSRSKSKPKFYEKIESNLCLFKITPGFNPKILRAAVDSGLKGIIIEGFGSGNVPIGENSLIPEIKYALKKNVPVAISTQCAIGCAWVNVYETGQCSLNAGAIPSYDLISETALTKMMWILGQYPNASVDKVRELMLKNLAGEISTARTPKEKRIWDYAL